MCELEIVDKLFYEGIIPNRRSITADSSILLEFFKSKVCIDIYPNEIIFIESEGDINNVFELEHTDESLDFIIRRLKLLDLYT